MPQILVRHGIDLKTFREEVLPANEPVVLKDLVAQWPAVRTALQSPRAISYGVDMSVNYWWNEARPVGSPFDAMLHGVPALRDLPPAQREDLAAHFRSPCALFMGNPAVESQSNRSSFAGNLPGALQ